MGDFGDAERRILGFMAAGTQFDFNEKRYKVILSDKPTCYQGEPKTDIYILAESDSDEIEIKISYKKENADFIENKMSAERAEQLFGTEWKEVIENSTLAIADRFAERMLIYTSKFRRTDKGSITLGWKFELMNKNSGELSGKMRLSMDQVVDVYAGSNLSEDKKNASVCGKIIENSGVANYILVNESVRTPQDVIDKMISIKEYVYAHPEIYFACKALNYRTFEEKWDGDRPLAVQVEWSADKEKLVPELVFDKPLLVKGNEAAERLLMHLKKLHIKTTDDINDENAGTDRIYRGDIMAVIIEERGRGKFKPAPDYKVDEIKELLNAKIEEERQAFADCSAEIEFDKLNYDPNKWNLLSLFSGCGGLDLGFELAGLKAVMGDAVMESAFANKKVFDENVDNNVFNTIYVNDIFDEARETYAQNAGKYIYMDKSDIRKIKEFPKADIVLGGFPCPGFSEAGPRLVDDKRNFLYLHFIRCLMQSKPKIFVAENVKGMMTLGKGEVFKQIVQDFAAAGYTIYHKLLNSAKYGVPQIRERVILVGVRNDIDFEYVYPEATHGYGVEGLKEVVTLRDAIGDLENDPGDYFKGSYSTIFMSRNRKKLWSQPSFTIQASGRQAPIHPAGKPMVKVDKDKYIFSDDEENNRRLSVKEIARIQTFPDWYEFSRGTSSRNDNAKLDLVYKQIGNAVPVKLALAVAEPIAEFAKMQLDKKENAYVVVKDIGESKRMMA